MSVYDAEAASIYTRHRRVQSGVLDALVALARAQAPSARVLEVGCGTGHHLSALCADPGVEAGFRGWGIDPAPDMVRQARAAAPGLGFSVGRAEALPFPAGDFDLLFSVDVVHHVGDLAAAFTEAARVLRPGGYLLTATDSEATIRARAPLSRYFPETVAHELARYPTVEALTALHRRAGLEVVRTGVAEHPHVVRDVGPFRDRAYSCLCLISDDALQAGLERLRRDLPLRCVSRNFVMVARKQ